MRGIAIANELPMDYFVPIFKDSFWVMRAIRYPQDRELFDAGSRVTDDDGIGCGTHTDYGFLTFINQDQTKNALQVYLLIEVFVEISLWFVFRCKMPEESGYRPRQFLGRSL